MTPYKPVDIIVTCPKVLRGFRRRALASKVEILGVLVGRVSGTKVQVNDIVYIETANATEHRVDYYDEDIHRIQGAIGTIHSHPDCEPGLSNADMVTQSLDGDVVFAVFSFWKKPNGVRHSTSLDWYCGSPETVVSTAI